MPLFRDIIYGKLPFKKFSKDTLICIDAANWYPFLTHRKIKINWEEFKGLMQSMFKTATLNYYDGLITQPYFLYKHPNSTPEEFSEAVGRKQEFYAKLSQFGYNVTWKEITQIHKGFYKDSTAEKTGFKCNFDVEITIDVMENLDRYEMFVLCSGDSDFVALVKKLKGNLKETMAISVKNRFSSDLRDAVNHSMFLNNLIHFVPALTYKK